MDSTATHLEKKIFLYLCDLSENRENKNEGFLQIFKFH